MILHVFFVVGLSRFPKGAGFEDLFSFFSVLEKMFCFRRAFQNLRWGRQEGEKRTEKGALGTPQKEVP